MTTSSTAIIKKLLILFLLISGLYFAKVFLMPICIGGVLATLFLPFCQGMEQKKIPKGLAATICILIFLLSIIFIISMLGWQIAELTTDFTLVKEKALTTWNNIQQYIFDTVGISKEKQRAIIGNEEVKVSTVMQLVGSSLASIFSNFILVLAYIFLLLYYRQHLKQFLLKLSIPSQSKEMEHVLHTVSKVSQQYLLGLIKMIVCLWIMYSIGFSILGIKNAFFFAILCGLLEIIPFIGNITGTTLTLLVATVQGANLPILAGIAATYAIVQLIQGWILEPLILGPQVKINPFTTIIALVIGNLIWGIPGVFLAIPIIAMLKIIFDHIDSLKPYGFLIGEIKTEKKEIGFIKKITNWFKKKGEKN